MTLAKSIRLAFPVFLSCSLIACGGGSGFSAEAGSTDTTSTTEVESTDTTSQNPDEIPVVLSIGKLEDTTFTAGQLKIGLTNLAAGGSTGVTAVLMDQNGNLADKDHSISFSSLCLSNGKSEIQSPIVSNNGIFSTTYIAKGCDGNDVITASVDGLSAQGTINVQPASLGAVEFISAEPQNILLKGMSALGFQHTSIIKFQIKNDVGGPIADADVRFELTTNVGGITLSATESKTDNNGFVSTILHAGTVHTSVRVRAIVEGNEEPISSESSQLVISTGIADQNSLSISLSTFNPAAYNKDGVEVDVNIIASDRYNNPVPDGTTVAFYTELGQIDPFCQTANGRCSVKWISSNPRDLGEADSRYPHDSITTITAKVIGEESFIDKNSNGIFDDGDQFDTLSDRGEAFEDYNMGYTGNSIVLGYDEGLEPYLDFNQDGIRNPNDGKYSGLGCKHSTLCAEGNGLKDIYTSAEIVLAESSLVVSVQDEAGQVPDFIENNKSYSIRVNGFEKHQIPPVSTKITVSSDDAKIERGSGTVPNSSFHEKGIKAPLGYYETTLVVKDKDESKSVGCGTVKVSVDDISTTSLYLDYSENTPRIAQNDAISTPVKEAIIIDVLDNDKYPTCKAIEITISTAPENGDAVVEDGKIKYTPNASFSGEDTFSYTFTDGYGEKATAEVTVTVIKANNDAESTIVDTEVTIDVLSNDIYPKGDGVDAPTIAISTAPENGVAVVEDNTIKYTPTANFSGIDTFSYTFTDGYGETATAKVTVTVVVVAVDDTASTTVDTDVTIDVLGNDTYPEGNEVDAPTITISIDPTNGVAVVEDNTIKYTPSSGYNGEDTFSYSFTDANGTISEAAVVTVTVNP